MKTGGKTRGQRQSSGSDCRYQMREDLVSIGDDFRVENAQGQKAFKVDGKALRVRDSYNVSIDPGQDDIVILAVTVCIDQMAH